MTAAQTPPDAMPDPSPSAAPGPPQHPPAHRAATPAKGFAVWKAVVLVVVVILAAELVMRGIQSKLPQSKAGDQAEVELKWDQITALAHAHQPTDIVFFGSSPMDSAIDPATWIATSKHYPSPYNAALLGQPYDSLNTWADKFVLPELKPDVVVYGLTPFDVPTFELQRTSRQIVDASFTDAFNQLRPNALDHLDTTLSKHSALIRNRAAFQSPNEMYDAIRDTVLRRKTPPNNALQPVTLPNKQVVARTPEVWKTQLLEPRGGDANYHGITKPMPIAFGFTAAQRKLFRTAATTDAQLATMVDTARRHGAKKVVFAVTPMMRDAYVPIVGSEAYAQQVIDGLDAYARSLGADVVDFSQARWPDTDFADSVHLSLLGSQRFSRELATYMDTL